MRFAVAVALRRDLRKPDLETFDKVMKMCRSYASGSSNATNLIIFEPMVMAIGVGEAK